MFHDEGRGSGAAAKCSDITPREQRILAPEKLPVGGGVTVV